MTDSVYSDFLRTLKEKNDIVEVIGSYIKLERKGYGYWACCPFHHEKTPSFSINAADRYYHCFGCGVSGDVVIFVQEYENVDFLQAVQILAARAKLDGPAYDDKTAEKNAEIKRKKDRLLQLMRTAARFYLNNLYSGSAEAHLEYLAGRKLQPTTVKKFGIGASLDFTSLPQNLLGQGFTPEECVESGVCVRSDSGRLTDAQGERLISPIINQRDEVIAFGGRLLKKSDRANYKNTKETLLFNKSKSLFGINLVKKLRRAGGLSSLIMVEGYMDAISLYQAGFQNVVASMGTSLTKEQARLCKRYSENVFISYDGDFAGQKANLRGLEILKDEGIKVRVVPMPDGLDPDDVIKTSGAEGYNACLERAMPLIDFRIHAAQIKYDLSKTDEKRDFVREALSIVKEAESATEREELVKKISEVSGVSRSALARDLESVPASAEEKRAPSPALPKEDNSDRERKAARFIIAACLLNKPYARACDLSELDFGNDELRTISDYILKGRAEGRIRPSGLFDIMQSDGELSEVLNLDYGDNLDGLRAERYFYDSVRTLKRKTLNEKISRAREEFGAAKTQEEKNAALLRLNELTKRLKNG